MGPDAMISGFWMLSFKSVFSVSFFTLIKRLFSSSLLSANRAVSSETYLSQTLFYHFSTIDVPSSLIFQSGWAKPLVSHHLLSPRHVFVPVVLSLMVWQNAMGRILQLLSSQGQGCSQGYYWQGPPRDDQCHCHWAVASHAQFLSLSSWWPDFPSKLELFWGEEAKKRKKKKACLTLYCLL